MHSAIETSARLRRLRWFLGLLFLGLAVPAVLLIRQGFVQLELTEFRRQQLLAEDVVRVIDGRLAAAIAIEEARPASEFDYAIPQAGDAGNVVQLSPLSSLAATNAFPGAIGYFQVDSAGELSTPLLPAARQDTVPAEERLAKTLVETELANVLDANRLLRARAELSPAAEPAPARQALLIEEATQAEQVALDQFRAVAERAEAEDLAAESVAAEASARESVRGQAAFDELAGLRSADQRSAERDSSESRGLNEVADADMPPAFTDDASTGTGAAAPAAVRVSTFAGELEPLRFGHLETGHFVLFRNAWRDSERFVQGMLIDPASFVTEAVDQALRNAGLAPGTQLTIAASGNEIATLSVDLDGFDGQIDASRLYSARLSPPLAEIEVAFASGSLERGPGFGLLAWTAIVLFGVLAGGLFAMYRYGAQQLRLAQQQQNFVSAVSHELKTPLTSIRMYGEMLKSGWADDEKKQTYYDYIFEEGERLSRLIDNVLQLARLNNSGPDLEIESISVAELFDMLRSKLSTQAESAGFELEFQVETTAAELEILGDPDALSQVFINLVDNAIKFAAHAPQKKIVVSARGTDRGKVVLAVRDFGPGVPGAELKRLFELFYRPDNELTRSTSGTGIGLALVRQLVTAMSGRVDVRNVDPGAEFRLEFPRAERA